MKGIGLLIILGFILLAVAIIAVEVLSIAGIVYLITLCFDLTFSWKVVFGISLIVLILTGIFGGKK